MPEIPRAGALTVPPNLTYPSPGEITGSFNSLAQGVSDLGAQAEAIREHTRKLHEAVQVAASVADYSAALTKQRIDLSSDPDYGTHADRFLKAGTELRDQMLGTLPSEDAQAAFLERAAPLLDGNHVAVYQQAEESRVADLQAKLMDTRQSLVNSAADAGNGPTRQMNLDSLHESITMDPALDGVQKQKLWQHFQGQLEQADFLRGTAQITQARSPQEAQAAAERVLRGIDGAQHLDPVAREHARRTTISEFEQAQTRIGVQGRRVEQEVREKIATGLLGRITGDDLKDMPSQAEIIEAPLLRTKQRASLISLRTKVLRGEGAASNPIVLDQAFRAVHSGAITTDEELVDLVGQGITMADYRKLSSDRMQMERPVRQDQFRQLDDLLSVAKGVMAPASLMQAAKPEALIRYGLFEKMARDRFDEEIEAGRDPRRTLFDPTSPDYLGKQIQPMNRREQSAAARAAFSSAPIAPAVPQRKEGQSPEDFLREAGGVK